MEKTQSLIKKTHIMILVFCLFSIHSVFADTNGIWTQANDIKAGTFGSDEGGGVYQFPSNVIVSNEVISSGVNTSNLQVNGNTQTNSLNVITTTQTQDLQVLNFARINELNVTNDLAASNIFSSGIISANEVDSATKVTANEFCIGTVCKTDWSTLWQQGYGGDIYYNGGAVGIGTTYPSYSLEIDASSSGASTYYALRAEGGTYGIRGAGYTGGGYFRDVNDYTSTYISYGDYSIYGYGDIKTTSSLCIDNECRDGFQVIKKANVNTGNFGWTNIYNARYQNGPGNKNDYTLVSLSEEPVLGVRISGKSDDGGLCVVQIGDFAATVGWSARVTELNEFYWTGRANDGNDGTFATKTFMIDELDAGIWSYKSGMYYTGSPQTIRGYFTNDYDHTNQKTWSYNKPLGMSYATDNYATIHQWYNDGQGSYYNDCKVDVLYGEYS